MGYIGNVPAEKYTALTQQTFSSPTGTSFTLSQAVTNSVDIDLYIDNVKQDPTTYSVSGTSLTTSTIASPSTMYCIFNGKAMQTVNPPDGSVGTAKVADDAITSAKIVDGAILNADINTSADIATTKLGAGAVVQVVNVTTGAVATTTTTMPYDDTIPQKTEGGEFLTLAITPTHASNKLFIEVSIHVGYSVAAHTQTALFQDSTAGSLASGYEYIAGVTQSGNMNFNHYMTSGTTSSTTFKVRCGGHTAGTVTLNGDGAARKHGGVLSSSITITEIAV